MQAKFSLEGIINDLTLYIEENLGKPRTKIINDYLMKKIEYNEFIRNFKYISKFYHKYCFIKEKLIYQSKMEQLQLQQQQQNIGGQNPIQK